MMRQRELLEFRTPQHPSIGKNNWGGASPFLAREIPKEALDQRYLRLNTVRDRDQIFATTIEEEIFGSPPSTTIRDAVFSVSKDETMKCRVRASRRWILKKIIWRLKHRTATLGSNMRQRWLPKLNSKKKWPNGWC